MKKEVKRQWDNRYENFEVWFNENYHEPLQTTTENTTINGNTTTDVS